MAATYLYLYDNNLAGSLLTKLGMLTAKTWLSLHTNQLMGNIPIELGFVTALEWHYGKNHSHQCLFFTISYTQC